MQSGPRRFRGRKHRADFLRGHSTSFPCGPLVDSAAGLHHACDVLFSSRRLPAIVLALILSAGNAGLCAGWMTTPEARMACCLDETACPMHAADSHDPGAAHEVSQLEADSCCLVSDRDDSAPPARAVVFPVALNLALGPVPTVVLPSRAALDLWRAQVPIPRTAVPRHILLSVFLI